jgi:hypothetical protein
MFTPIEGLHGGAIGVRASGQITLADRRSVLEPGITSALETGDKVKLLYVAGPDFDGYDDGGLFDEAVFGTRHFTAFEKIAFVADDGPYDRAVHALEGLMPAALKVFPTRSIEAAKAWVAA